MLLTYLIINRLTVETGQKELEGKRFNR